uniref:mRNA export factor GLE1 n=1 Tax=Strigamia maritima TaxID=126957 RepID=T1ITX7_STRMM
MKKYKFMLKKAISITVNTISPSSGSHLRDKLVRLKTLLQGQAVVVGDTQRVSANEHPQGLVLAKDLVAKQFVRSGNEQISSNLFAVATVIIGVWAEIPDFGDLFLGHLHKRCPYTVPYYVAREENQTQEDYNKAQGYMDKDGVMENKQAFLKRMSGYIRLYASVICSPMPRAFNKPHPYSLDNGWKWLIRVLNLEPRPDVTATILVDFLETAGCAMQQAYGTQFNKLLAVLCQYYLPKIRQVSASDSSGPLTRLEDFLRKCVERNRIAPPEDLLSENF